MSISLDDYKVVLYRNQPSGWVAEISAIGGCYALMPTRNEAMAELEQVFAMFEAEYRETGKPLPVDTTEIVHAKRPRRRVSPIAVGSMKSESNQPRPHSKRIAAFAILFAVCVAAVVLFLWRPNSLFRRREIANGRALVLQVEAFRRNYGRLPNDLTELGVKDQDLKVFYQKQSDRDYIVWFGTSLGESEVYDSATRKWD